VVLVDLAAVVHGIQAEPLVDLEIHHRLLRAKEITVAMVSLQQEGTPTEAVVVAQEAPVVPVQLILLETAEQEQHLASAEHL
jgi:hypothetical protein